jgi:hypothetical protein
MSRQIPDKNRRISPLRLVRGSGPHELAPSVLTIGTFDGIHVGHAALIARTRALAAATGCEAGLLSFEPMPREVLNPADPPARLTSFRERWRLLEHSGLARLHLLTFDARLRSRSGAEFMALLQGLRARAVIIGHDFRFGRGGQASAEWCAAEARSYGFDVEVIAPVLVEGERASSGLIRSALAAGDLSRARFAGYERAVQARFRYFRRFAAGFYDPAFRDIFFQRDKQLGINQAVSSVLAGNWRPSLATRVRLAAFFALVRLQRHVTIAPRWLDPGETTLVTFRLDARVFQYWDPGNAYRGALGEAHRAGETEHEASITELVASRIAAVGEIDQRLAFCRSPNAFGLRQKARR